MEQNEATTEQEVVDQETPEEQAAPDAEAEAPEEELDALGELALVLKESGMDNPPSREQLEQWKAQHKNLRAFTISPDAIFVFKPLNREEYRQITSIPDAMRTANEKVHTDDIQNQIEDKICETAVLYPYNVVEFLDSYGGLAKSLSDQITMESYFIPVELAPAFVTKL